MRRRRYGYNRYETNNFNNGILLAEFMFYNKTKKIINEKVLKSIEKKILAKKEQAIYWTNVEFAKQKTGFSFFSDSITEDGKVIKDIFIKIHTLPLPFTVSQFTNCNQIYKQRYLLDFELTPEQDDYLSSNLNGDMTPNQKITSFKSWDSFIEFCIDNNLLETEQNNNWENIKETYEGVFGVPLTATKPEYEIINHTGYNNVSSYVVLQVDEKRINNKNYRCIFMSYQYSSYRTEYYFKIIPETDKHYNFYDVGRIFFEYHSRKCFLDMSLREEQNGKTVINQAVFYKISQNIGRILNENEHVITPFVYRFYKSRVDSGDNDSNYFSDKEIKIINKYKELLQKDVELKIGNTRISKNKIQVDGNFFCIKFGTDFLDTVKDIGKIKNILQNEETLYNFNDTYEKLLKASLIDIIRKYNTKERKYINFEKVNFKVNDIPISVTKNLDSKIRINDIYCRIDDIFHILSKAICFKTKDDFDAYVKDVSHIGIEWKQMIGNGVRLQLSNPFYDTFRKTGMDIFEQAFLRFSLVWDSEKRSKVYLLLNDKKYLIRYKAKFKQEFNIPNQIMTLSKLKRTLEKCVEGIDNERIIEIVENATKEAQIIKDRGLELVRETIKDIKAVAKELEIRSATIKGYYFKGRLSGAEYFVNETNLAVYKKMNGAWNKRCVVDDHTKNRIFEDRLANRLVNIYNEPDKIYTIK